jgi:D-psicose/D-tagatose/L-ribulose 3-epimerase
MARLGINLMAWSAGVDMPLFDASRFDAVAVRAALRKSDLAATVSSALPAGASLLDRDQAAAGVRFLRGLLEACAAVGSELLCGPLYAPVGHLPGRPRTDDEWRCAVTALRMVALAAEELGVRVALEPLNRFETFFLNTAADARRLVDEVGSPAVGVLLDTFHMNVEEKDSAEAVEQAGEKLYHLHLSENDRGVVGTGQVPWGRVWEALRGIGYGGWLTNETFNGRLPELAAATAIWRPLVPDPMTYARESLRFARALTC